MMVLPAALRCGPLVNLPSLAGIYFLHGGVVGKQKKRRMM